MFRPVSLSAKNAYLRSMRKISFILAAVLAAACAGSRSDASYPAPELTETAPAEGSVLSSANHTVTFTFDQNVRFAPGKSSGITIDGGASVGEAAASGNTVGVQVKDLEPSRSYTLTIPAGSLTGLRRKQAEVPAIKYHFSTSDTGGMHVFICFGQSNMEGQGDIAEQDRTGIPDNFLLLPAVDFSQSAQRTKGEWCKAVPPLCRDWTRIGPTDYFGRTVAAALPEGESVGVIVVAVGGSKIEAFMDEKVDEYLKTIPASWESWYIPAIAQYDNRMYDRIIEMGRLAQERGVIEGFLFHQGESNQGDPEWPAKVKTVYERLLADLGLDSDRAPILVGEVVGTDMGGVNAPCNEAIATLPSLIPNCHVIPSKGLECQSDNLHFSTAGYREFGRRYAAKMLELKGW